MNWYQFEQKIAVDFPVDEKFVGAFGEEMDGSEAWDALRSVKSGFYGASEEWFFANVPCEYKARWIEMEAAMTELARLNKKHEDDSKAAYLDAGDDGYG